MRGLKARKPARRKREARGGRANPPRLVTRKYEQQRLAILDAAAAVFNRNGVKGTTLSDIAASVGLIKTSVTYYFKRKEDLAAACFLRSIEECNRLIDDAAGPGSLPKQATPRQRVTRFLEGYFDLYRAVAAGEQAGLLLFGDLRAMTAPHVGPLFAAYTDMFRNLRRLLRALGSGADKRQSLNARTHFLLSQVLWTTGWLERYEPADYPRVAARLADIVLDGILPAGHRGLDSARVARPNTTPPDDPHEAFLQAATDLINEQGYHGASVEKISAKLSVTKGSFYHRYKSKDEIVVACFERTFALVREAIALTQDAPDNAARLQRIGAHLVQLQMSERGHLLRTSALAALPVSIRTQMKSNFRSIADKLADLISDGIAERSLRPTDPFIAAQAFTATINSAQELPRWVPGATAATALALYLPPLFEGVLDRAH